MLRSIKDLLSLTVEATDGTIGKSKDCLFDDRHWGLRYLVVDTGNWIPGKKVLISPIDLIKPVENAPWLRDSFPVDLTKNQIENSPSLDEDAPISRQYEIEFAQHYNHHSYWGGIATWGMFHTPFYDMSGVSQDQAEQAIDDHQEHLEEISKNPIRSAKELIGYEIKVGDESCGKIEDFLIDDNYWNIHYLIIGTNGWLPGDKLLVDIDWINQFHWNDKTATVDLTKEEIEASPTFDFDAPVNKHYIDSLYRHYGKHRRDTLETVSR